MSSLLLLLLAGVAGAGECEVTGHTGVPRCVTDYVEMGGRLMGLFITKDPGGAVTLSVTIAYKLMGWWGWQIHFNDVILVKEENTYQTDLLRYYVPLPVKIPKPIITNIMFNNKVVCSTEVSPFMGYFTMQITHFMNSRRPKAGSSPPTIDSGSTAAPDSRGTTNASTEPGLDASSTPAHSEVPPPVRTSPTRKTPNRPLATRRTTQPPQPTTVKPVTIKTHSVTKPTERVYCGISVRPQMLILGGRDVEKGDWPWVGTLHDANTTKVKCAATLVGKRFVVVAAHCVIDPVHKTQVKEEGMVLIMGKFDLSKWVERGMQAREIRKIFLHPDFSLEPLTNDIALLYLEEDIDYTLYARPICLFDDPEDIDSKVNEVATVIGWNPGGSTPRRAMVPIVSQQDCLAFTGQVAGNTFCAGNATFSGHCVCDADSGLYLPVVGLDGNLRWYLRGIPSSHLHNDLDACKRGGYVVYADAAQYTPWIRHLVTTTRPYHD